MSETTSNLPICIHCGTARPADETLCPNCGKPWIDVTIEQPPTASAAPTPPAAVGATTPPTAPPPVPAPAAPEPRHDTGEFGLDEWTLPPEPPKSKAIWAIPVVLLVGVVGFWVYFGFINGSGTTTTLAAVETTTTQVDTTTTAPDTTTTSDTSSTTTTTLPPFPSASAWPAVGDPIDQADLGLKAGGIGPIDFGAPLPEAAGILVSSLGEAEAAGIDDVCEPGEAYWLQWGPLRAIFDGTDTDATFVSYRYEDTGAGTAAVDLATLSGIRLGDSVEKLRETYVSYTVTFEVIEGADHFRLVDGSDLLLWGPVSSTDPDGTIEGIYSPSSCPSGS